MKRFSPCKIIGSREELLSLIDNTNLSPTLTLEDAEDFTIRSFEEGFYCSMVPPHHAQVLSEKGYSKHGRICTVYCFPYPYYSREECVKGLRLLPLKNFAEIDVVAPLHLVKSGEWEQVKDYLRALTETVHLSRSKIKLIVEAPMLSDEELDKLVSIASEAGVDWVKTSTGVISKGGDPYTVYRLSRAAREYGIPVKAAGGIRTIFDAAAAVGAGAKRIGTSSGFKIIEQYEALCGRE